MALSTESVLHTAQLFTDASDKGIGAVLSEEIPEGEKPVHYPSRQLTPTEQKYAMKEKEAFVVKWVIETLHYYLEGGASQLLQITHLCCGYSK